MRSRVVTASRLLGRAKCERADYLRHEDELVRIAIASEAEPLVRGGVIHAGMAAALERFPAEPDPALVAAACTGEAIARGLSHADPRIAGWTRVSLRAAKALEPAAWEPVRLQDLSGGAAGGAGADTTENLATGRTGDGRGNHPPAGSSGAPLVEIRLTVPVCGGWVFSFKPDAVMRHRASGRIWLIDHKTKGQFSRVETWTELHLQSLLYVRALREYGVDCHGAMLYQILADEPKVPTFRKDGHLKEISWNTDWDTACIAIAQSADPDPESDRYADLRASCATRTWQYDQRVLYDEAELESAWDHLVEFCDDLESSYDSAVLRAGRRGLPVWRTVRPSGRGQSCGRCDYAAWCHEDFVGRNPETMIGDAYRRGGDKYLAEVALTTTRADIQYMRHEDFDGIDTGRARP